MGTRGSNRAPSGKGGRNCCTGESSFTPPVSINVSPLLTVHGFHCTRNRFLSRARRLITLNQMRASEEITEEQSRQMLFDVEHAYSE